MQGYTLHPRGVTQAISQKREPPFGFPGNVCYHQRR